MRKEIGSKKRRPARRQAERTVYLILIVILVFYGLKDSGAAVSLIGAIRDAFSLLFNNTP